MAAETYPRARKKADTVITLSDKRLLDMSEFSIYASVGICTARELADTTSSLFRCGNRVLVDRVKFDRWCDEHNEA